MVFKELKYPLLLPRMAENSKGYESTIPHNAKYRIAQKIITITMNPSFAGMVQW